MDSFSDRLFEYAAHHSSAEPQLLAQLRKETYQKILQPRMLSGPLQGRLLSILSKMTQPNRILELGTFTGYATLCLAEGLEQNGEIHTIDKNEELVDFQNKYFEASGKARQIHSYLGEALHILPTITGTFDLIFIDADKINTVNYFHACIDRLRKGGLLLTDNVLWSGKVFDGTKNGDKETAAIKDFNELAATDSRVETVFLPLRDGLTLSRKI